MAARQKCDGEACEAKAVVWCDDCAQAICSGCLVWHEKFNGGHDVQPLLGGGDRAGYGRDGAAAIQHDGDGRPSDNNRSGVAVSVRKEETHTAASHTLTSGATENVATTARRKCDGEECDAEGIVWCDECAQAICSNCLVWHQKLNGGHDVQPLLGGGDRAGYGRDGEAATQRDGDGRPSDNNGNGVGVFDIKEETHTAASHALTSGATQKVATTGRRKCDGDGCDAEAIVWCDECAQAICSDCLVWHAKFNAQHDVHPVESGGCGGSGVPDVFEGDPFIKSSREDHGFGSGKGGDSNDEEDTVAVNRPMRHGGGGGGASLAALVAGGGGSSSEWLQCCACSQPLRDPVQLQCLHNCCKSCLRTIVIVKAGQEVKDGDDTTKTAAGMAAAVAAPTRAMPTIVRCPFCNEASRTTVGRTTNGLNENAFVARLLAARQQHNAEGGPPSPADGTTVGRDAAGRAAAVPSPTTCDVCAEEEQSVEAHAWCGECSQALCSNCLPWHDKFNPRHAPAALGSRDVPGTGNPSAAMLPSVDAGAPATDAASGDDVVRCPLHAPSPYEFDCAQCHSLKCADCLRACVDRKHVVALANDPREHVRRAAERVRAAQHSLESATGALPVVGDYERLLGSGGELAAAQAADARRLAMNRDRAITELQRAYSAAEQTLSEAYAAARSRAEAAFGAVGAVRASSALARAYSDRLLDAGDPGSIAQQQPTLLSRMRALKKRAEILLESPVPAAEDWVGLEAERSTDLLAGALRKWLGIASLREGLMGRLEANSDDEDCGEGGGRSSDDESDGESSELNALLFERAAAAAAGPAAAKGTATAECVDAALTTDGHLLVAVVGEPSERGLREYDSSGVELRRWRPPRPGGTGQFDFVWSVAALDDGRVAAGLLNAKGVQLLRRGPAADSWLRDRWVAVALHPRRLSICGEAMAIAGGRLASPLSTGNGCPNVLPGSALAVLASAAAAAEATTVADGAAPSRDLDYDILALVLTTRSLIVTSAGHLDPPPEGGATGGGGGGGGSASYAVLALDRAASSVLWRYASDEPLAAACTYGGALYMLGRDSGAVLAIDVRRGRKAATEVLRLGVVDDDDRARKSPTAAAAAAPLSASLRVVHAAGPDRPAAAALAVLFDDRRTARVYPSVGAAA